MSAVLTTPCITPWGLVDLSKISAYDLCFCRGFWIINIKLLDSFVYWTVHHLDSWIKRDQLDVTCFIISLFNAQHVSDVSTSILRSLWLICWVIHELYCSGTTCVGVTLWFGWGGVVSYLSNTTHEITQRISRKLLRMDVLTSETCWAWNKIASDIKLVYLYSITGFSFQPTSLIQAPVGNWNIVGWYLCGMVIWDSCIGQSPLRIYSEDWSNRCIRNFDVLLPNCTV